MEWEHIYSSPAPTSRETRRAEEETMKDEERENREHKRRLKFDIPTVQSLSAIIPPPR